MGCAREKRTDGYGYGPFADFGKMIDGKKDVAAVSFVK